MDSIKAFDHSDVRGAKHAFASNASLQSADNYACPRSITQLHEPVQQPRLPDSERRTMSCRSFRLCADASCIYVLGRCRATSLHLIGPSCQHVIEIAIFLLFSFTFHSTVCYQQHRSTVVHYSECAMCNVHCVCKCKYAIVITSAV